MDEYEGLVLTEPEVPIELEAEAVPVALLLAEEPYEGEVYVVGVELVLGKVDCEELVLGYWLELVLGSELDELEPTDGYWLELPPVLGYCVPGCDE